MRASTPLPGDSWPPDMVLTIEDHDRDLLELLWVRALYRLTPDGEDVPPAALLADEAPLTEQALHRRKGAWNLGWAALWSAALQRHDPAAGHPAAAEVASELDLEQVVTLLHGPSWRTRFDDRPFDAEYHAWIDRLRARRTARQARRGDDLPERRSLPALTAAWRRGLNLIITIPCVGTCTRTLSPTTLLITEPTREEPAAYSHALSLFRR